MPDVKAQADAAITTLPDDYLRRIETVLRELCTAQVAQVHRLSIVSFRTESELRFYVRQFLDVL